MSTTAWTILIALLTVLAWLAAFYILIRLFIIGVTWLLGTDDGPGPENQF